MKVWSVAKVNKERAIAMANRLEIPPLLAMMLDIRGITKEEDVINFLQENKDFSDPFLMKDMDKAVERITTAVENGEKICVYGDYDADGVTSTSLLYSYLRDSLGADVMFYIPTRTGEGYGMNKGALDKIHSQGVTLIITVDNGISAREEIDYGNTLGIDTVITDHHMPSGEIPKAVAVVNAHQKDDKSPFKDFSGVGVAFKLVMAIEGEYADVDSLLENFSDIATLGTIGDIVPLVGENRTLVKNGLRHIQNSDRIGINAMKQESGIAEKEINSSNVAFTLVPRINAGGRLGSSEKSVNLLLTEDEDEAVTIADKLGMDNRERQSIEKEILASIDEEVRRTPNIVNDKILVFAGKGWHQGVVGIVASRIKEIYDKPTIIIGIDDDGVARGSGRSVEGFSLCDAVFACSEHLTHYGGHPMAVGISLEKEKINDFRKAINAYCKDIKMPYNILHIDCKLNPNQLDLSILDSLSYIEPCGASNPSPIFGLYNMTVIATKEMGNGKHMRITLSRGQGQVPVYAVYFNHNFQSCSYRNGDIVDVAVSLDRNIYNGQENLSVIIKDIKYSQSNNEELIDSERIFDKFAKRYRLTKNEVMSILPTRNDFAYVYRFLKQNKGFIYGEYALVNALNYKISMGKLIVILYSMKELGLINWQQGLYQSIIEMKESGKVNLEDSVFIKKLKEGI
ncbi:MULTISPECIES: single-stranded-DNA-specific exonuclease RecJ [Ruminococcus]|uniref:Single-stranded-DNA-specific exonuclease RecJ n=1 Tax=Ruminococcus bovis TaxID=2564099 RepID=A0A4P8XWK5_9FIRM|nr:MULTISPECIES: single-stranded-DNA-specific exonuclease RecJ [Ruminococcus]MEE3438567.1 single-stranded-DNA-specific exonuclease RecJ [Ruminococcus sp.]QCT07521.1 single-stranded-DNA-specific exonuclease RecJ [Ruminococcus bovis]